MNFEDKVIVVTGASSGIGADAARHLAKLGGKVSIVGRNEERLNAVAEEIINEGSPEPLVIVADVTADAERIINETIDHFGKLDVLVNSAGFGFFGSIMDTDISVYDDLMNTNVRSVIVLTQLAVPHLETTKGNVVNISSLAGTIVMKGAPYYSISKAAVDQFTKCAAVELGPKGIRVNSVNPGIVKTGFSDAAGFDEEAKEAKYTQFGNAYPVGRVGVVSDTSNAIAYLASEEAAFVTGTNLVIDGGAGRAGVF